MNIRKYPNFCKTLPHTHTHTHTLEALFHKNIVKVLRISYCFFVFHFLPFFKIFTLLLMMMMNLVIVSSHSHLLIYSGAF